MTQAEIEEFTKSLEAQWCYRMAGIIRSVVMETAALHRWGASDALESVAQALEVEGKEYGGKIQ